jgi:isopentenyl diphosphate isomerase/L-lactate dehydrogenase-like FMN-dependent dehydrogenase
VVYLEIIVKKMGGFKCHFCPVCDGTGCVAEFPGMGGVLSNVLFQRNCASWKDPALLEAVRGKAKTITKKKTCAIRLGPITGAVENVGWRDEQSFYRQLIHASYNAGVHVTAGDGCPDIKLQSGIAALLTLPNNGIGSRAAVFIKPYDNARIFERIMWSIPAAQIIGVDIDSYDIVTMRNLVNLEKKTSAQLLEIKKNTPVPFAVKGVILDQDVSLVQEVKPDIVVVSNHGGRVDRGSLETPLEFLLRRYDDIRGSCDEIWIDGGIRDSKDARCAQSLGVSEILIGRPFISALCEGGEAAVQALAKKFTAAPHKQNCPA